MSTPQWQNLPQPPERRAPGWDLFALDPRRPEHAALRASDADRNVAADVLTEAHAQGRLSAEEYAQRLDQARSATTLGEVVSILDDLVPERTSAALPAAGPSRARRAFVGYARMVVTVNLIYLVTSLMTGHFYYYWPIWPMVFVGLPLALRAISSAGFRNRADRDREARRQLPGPNDLR